MNTIDKLVSRVRSLKNKPTDPVWSTRRFSSVLIPALRVEASSFNSYGETNRSDTSGQLIRTDSTTSIPSSTSTAVFVSNTSLATSSSPSEFGNRWVLHALLDINTDLFFSVVDMVESEIQVLDDLVLILGESEQNDLLRRIGNARKRIAVLFRVLSPKKKIFEALSSRELPLLGSELQAYFRDALDHVNSMLEKLTFAKEMLLSSHSNYLAQISIELAQNSNKMNGTVNKLSSLATILLPLSLVTGIWGMNVAVPGQYDGSTPYDLNWFFVIVGSMGMVFIVLAVWFRWANLL